MKNLANSEITIVNDHINIGPHITSGPHKGKPSFVTPLRS